MAAVMGIVVKRGSQLDPELVPTDELLSRWVKQTREHDPMSRTALGRAIDEQEGAALPGGEEWIPDDVLVLDRVIAKSPARVQLFVDIWYVRNGTSDTRAARLGISRAALYSEWKATLWFVRGMLIGAGVRI